MSLLFGFLEQHSAMREFFFTSAVIDAMGVASGIRRDRRESRAAP